MVKLRYSSKAAPVPRAWTVRAKLRLAAVSAVLKLPTIIRISDAERRRPPPPWQTGIQDFIGSSLAFAVTLLGLCVVALIAWGTATRQDFNQLWSEMGGLTMDVLVVLIIYEAFNQRRARRAAIQRQIETIDDYKRWDAEEAGLRIAGALRRLARSGVTKVDFSGLVLTDFDFAEHGISSLRGSTFYDGDWGDPLNNSKIRLNRVSFGHVNCSGVEFSPFDPFEALDDPSRPRDRSATMTDCRFNSALLEGATFNGAALLWTSPPPQSHYEYDEEEDGTPYWYQASYGPFADADLAGAQFRGCRFDNVDFRDAHNIRTADFFRATGLSTAHFDSAEDRDWVIASSTRDS